MVHRAAFVVLGLAAASNAQAHDARDSENRVKLRPGLTLEVGGGQRVTLSRDGSDDRVEAGFCQGLVMHVEWNRQRTALTFRCDIVLNDGDHTSSATVPLAELEATYEDGVAAARRADKRDADAEPHLARAHALAPTQKRAFALAAVRLRLGQGAQAGDVVRPYLAHATAEVYGQILLDPEIAPLADVPGLLVKPAHPGTAIIAPDGRSLAGGPFAATDEWIAYVAHLGALGEHEAETVSLVAFDRRNGAPRAKVVLWHRGGAPLEPNLAAANRFLRDLGFVTPAGIEVAGAPDDERQRARRLRLVFGSGAALEYRAAGADRGSLRLVGADGKERGRRTVDLWRDARVDFAALWPDAALALVAFHHDGSDQGEGYDSLHGSDGEASLAVLPLGNRVK